MDEKLVTGDRIAIDPDDLATFNQATNDFLHATTDGELERAREALDRITRKPVSAPTDGGGVYSVSVGPWKREG